MELGWSVYTDPQDFSDCGVLVVYFSDCPWVAGVRVPQPLLL